MRKRVVVVSILATAGCLAQAPTGTITGSVKDPAGAVIPTAKITVQHRATGLRRELRSNEQGEYSAPALAAGSYEVGVEALGLGSLIREALVEAGSTTTVDLILTVGDVTQSITVEGASPQMRYDGHHVGGVITRSQIEALPLNGRNFLDLARFEPGVTNPARVTNNRTVISVLGTGLTTVPRIGSQRVTVDGGSVGLLGTYGSTLNVSQEVVQEFQISTVNFDLATSLTGGSAINIVTRSGGNEYHGSGFWFYRDHNLAAYPGLRREPSNPDPFFQRKQYGGQAGGPIRKDRAFFFGSLERNDQRAVLAVQPRSPDFALAGGVFPSPFRETLASARVDARLTARHNAFVRYSHDGNKSLAPVGAAGAATPLPSGWSQLSNFVDQSLLGATSVLSPAAINDLRFSYFFHSSPEKPPVAENCMGCLGLGAPRVNIADAGIVFGNPRTLSFLGRRFQVSESLTWQSGSHRLRFGFDWERTVFGASVINQEPANLNLWSPQQVRSFNAAQAPEARIPLPASFGSLDDILALPLMTFSTGIGPGTIPQPGFRKQRAFHLYRLYAGDTWRVHPRLTLNYGMAWSYEPDNLNYDLTKPNVLIPLLGMGGLKTVEAQARNFGPVVGFAWTATRDGKTVVRVGAGHYYDPIVFNTTNLVNERQALLPEGTGRSTIMGNNPAITRLAGRPLDFRIRPTSFTGAQLLSTLPVIRAELLRERNPGNRDFSVRNLEADRSGQNLFDPFYETPYSLHFSAGMQRELARNLVVSADFVQRRFLHTQIPSIDYNRFGSARGVIIPGYSMITFDNSTGIAQYRGLLIRVEKRFSGRTQFLASYALSSNVGSNATAAGLGFNNDNWFENYGPLANDRRHVLNVSGFIELPRHFQVSFGVSYYSRPPFSAFVSGVDFNGDGTASDLLPGTKVNQFNRGTGRDELLEAVGAYNRQYAGKSTAGGQLAPPLTLPDQYEFNDRFFSQDLRISRSLRLTEKARLVISVEVFNLLNIANLVDYSGNVAVPASFGQAGVRFDQVFGSGGPRAFQLATRVSF